MNNYSLKGVSDWFRLGKKGPIIKKDVDKIQFRNALDTDFINIQALDPVDPQDMVTLQYMQANSSNLPFNTDNTLHSIIDYLSGVQQIGVVDIPVNALAYQIQVEVTQVWDDVASTLDIGTGTTNARLMDQAKVDLTNLGIYVIETSDIFASLETINAYLSNATSTQGSAEVTVLYTISEAQPITPIGYGEKSINQTNWNIGDTRMSLFNTLLTDGLDGTLALWVKYDGSLALPNTLFYFGAGNNSRDQNWYDSDTGIFQTNDMSAPAIGSFPQNHDLGALGIDLTDGLWHLVVIASDTTANKRYLAIDGVYIPPVSDGVFQSNLNPTGFVEPSSLFEFFGETFQHDKDFSIKKITFNLLKFGSPTGNLNIRVYDNPLKSTLLGTSNPIGISTLTLVNAVYTFNFSTEITGLLANTEYYFEISNDGNGLLDGANTVGYGYQTNGTYANGTYHSLFGEDLVKDLTFSISGVSSEYERAWRSSGPSSFGRAGFPLVPMGLSLAHGYAVNRKINDAEMLELYNSGIVIDPLNLSFVADIVHSWSMGDNASDTISTIVDEIGSKDLTVYGGAITITIEHPNGN